jgi:hypothetical protein
MVHGLVIDWMECFNKELGLEFGVCLIGGYESTYGKVLKLDVRSVII